MAAPRRSWFVWPVIALALLAGTVAVVGGWALQTRGGALWLIGQVPGLQVEGVTGTVLGELRIARVVVPLPGDTPGSVTIDALRWQGLQLVPAQGRGWLRLELAALGAARVAVQPPVSKPGNTPRGAPDSLVLPLQLRIAAVEIAELRLAGLADPVLDLRAALDIGAEGGQSHAVEGLALRWGELRLGGDLRVGADAPLATQLAVHADHPQWHAEARADGPLGALRSTLTLRGVVAAGAAAPSADAQAVLRPFAPWPVDTLDARTRGLDLRALGAALPATLIDADARVRSAAADQPAEIALKLVNRGAGRVDEGRLPVTQLALGLRARPNDPRTLVVESFDAELGSATRPAGRVTGRGRWTPARWTLEATLADLQPDRLDWRAPALRVAGPLTLEGSGFDSAGLAAATVAARGQLAGRLLVAGSPRDARLALDATATQRGIEIAGAELSIAGAKATLAGALQRDTGSAPGWRAKGRLALTDFDPQPWWPGESNSPWRRGPHRLNAQGDFDLAIADAARKSGALRWAELRGNAALTLDPSRLAGVAVTGRATLRNDGSGTALVGLDADADGNRVALQGRVDARGDGNSDHWEATLAAPALARLAPALRLVSNELAGATGRIDADLRLDGRWPALRGSGKLAAEGLRVGALTLRRAQGSLQVEPNPDAPLALQLTLADAAFGAQSLEAAQLSLTGTARSHQLTVSASSKALPPAWTLELLPGGGTAPTRSTLRIEARGGFTDAPDAPRAGWSGRLASFVLGADLGGGKVQRWLATGEVDAAVRWAGGPLRFQVEPGRAELLGSALRWQRIAWQDGSPATLEARAELDPTPIAPLLRRLQPDFGWGGDLRIGARVELRSAPTFAADIVVERAEGDLTVTDEVGVTALGLTDLRLGLNAAEGVWSFTQALAGTTVGVGAGAVVARTTPTAMWPPQDTPISGVLELGVANLGTWGPWVPAGWRLGGNLRVGASIGGRFGAPEYTGVLRGSGITVRNFVEGVAVGDGELVVQLEGERAVVERISARAGDGTVRMTGEASFGAAPVATLDLVADRFQLLGRVDRRIVASGTAKMRLDRSTLALDGAFKLDQGLFDFSRRDAPGLSDDVVVVRASPPDQPQAPTSPPERRGPLITPRIDLQVDLGNELRVRGRGLETKLRGDLRISNAANRLQVNGVVRTAAGNYAAYGQKLAIDRGVLSFTGAADNPRLEIEATRPNIDLRVGVAVTGTAQAPRVRLFSEPEMSEIDKLSWLVLGRASDGLGSAETALLQRAALALLAGDGEGFTDQFIKALGLDEVSVRRSDGEVRETVVSLGKQLSRRWYVGYERSLNQTVGTWQLVYRIAQRFTLRAQSGLDNSLDAIWTWRW